MARVLPVLVAACLLLPPSAPAFPGDRDGAKAPSPESMGAPENRITAEHQAAIDRGLRWLATQQGPNGAFPTTPQGGGGNARGADYQTAVTALATLSFLGAGHGLRHGPYQDKVRKAVQWLLQAQQGSSFPGFISAPGDNQSKMHGHGFGTLALAEAYGTASSPESGERESRDPEVLELRKLAQALRKGIQSAVDCIESSQSSTGGWDYMPSSGGSSDHEGSVTVCEVQALLAAANRGFRVSLPRIQRAREYMKRSQAAAGGFKYRLSMEDSRGRGSESFALTAAGITSLIGLSEYDRKDAMDRAFKYMERAGRPDLSGGNDYPFYGSFYGVQAYHWIGGEKWKNYWLSLRPQILERQNPDGGNWTGHDTALDLGDVYPTAFCLLMLEVPVGYLSIFAK
jgi:hypothetical protein